MQGENNVMWKVKKKQVSYHLTLQFTLYSFIVQLRQ